MPLQKPMVIFSDLLQNLTRKDQLLFTEYGIGPVVNTPYQCIHHAFEAQVEKIPDEIAVCHLDQSFTYWKLNNHANHLAALMSEHGVVQGDNIGIFLQRSIPMITGMLAALKLGCSYVPQHVGVSPDDQLIHIVKEAQIKVILTTSEFEADIPEMEGVICIKIDEIMNRTEPRTYPNPDVAVRREDGCFILFTSGTTGLPNGVQVSHKNLCNVVLNPPANLSIGQGTKVGQILSIAFDMCAWEIWSCIGQGGTLLIRGKNIRETAEKANVIISTPTILSTIDPDKCEQVESVAVAGEPCSVGLANKWAEKCSFYNACGPTETTIVNTVQKCLPNATTIFIGKPIPNSTVYILDDHLKPLPIGEIGIMWAGGDCVSLGYLNNDTLNKSRYAPDPFLGGKHKMFRTGDLGRWNKNGELETFGRADDQVKVCGFRVELDSVSAALESVKNTKRAVTLKYDDRSLVAFTSPENIDLAKVNEKLEATLPYYAIPKKIIAMEALPMTSRGKIDKRLLLKVAKEHLREEEPMPRPEGNVSNYKAIDKVSLPKKLPLLKRMWKGPALMHYNRLILLVLGLNALALFYGMNKGWFRTPVDQLITISNLILYNFFLGIIVRQQYLINLFFKIATSFPTSWPLAFRRQLGKVYHFGGLHVGGNVSGTLWFIAYLVLMTRLKLTSPDQVSNGLLLVSYSIVGILIAIIVIALPVIRSKKHDLFERSHRFFGWIVLGLFWWQSVLFAQNYLVEKDFGSVYFTSSGFGLLLLITFSVALPWLRLKKVKVHNTKPSDHVTLSEFNYGVTPFAGSSTALSRNPLTEWHSFANVPSPGKEGFRLTISRAGDWTGKYIDDQVDKIWVKGIPTAGVGNIDQIFKRVLWVATGSGIGPCLPHLLSEEVPSLLIWATRDPRKTYGNQLVNEILTVQPDAIIWNTDSDGKPDLVKLAYQAYLDFDAEAVICISNKHLTWKVVEGMESRGIPAYGAIWDS